MSDQPPVVPRPLLLGDQWHGARPGGLNRYLVDLLESLVRLGAEPRAVVMGPAVGAPAQLTAAGLASDVLPRRLVRYWQAAVEVGRGATVVDAHFALNAFLPVSLGPLRRVPLVVHFQGPWADESLLARHHSRSVLLLKRLIELCVYRRAARVVVLSSAFRRVLVERYGISPWRIAVVPPGVDLDRFCPGDGDEARRSLGVPEGTPVALCVRRLVPRMGLDVVLEAWSRLVRSGLTAVLLVAGAGSQRAELESLVHSLGIGPSVRFLGRVDDRSLVACYRAADAAIVPTTALEGFGLVVLEALACGTPVIATDVGGLPEALLPLDPSLVVPARDPEALAARLAAGFDGSSPLPAPARCRAYAESFGWEGTARRHLSVYAEAHAGRDRRPRPRVVYVTGEGGGRIAEIIASLDQGDVHVVALQDGPWRRELEQAGVSVEVLRGGGATAPSPNLWAAGVRTAARSLRLARRLRRLRPDEVRLGGAGTFAGTAARLLGARGVR